MNWQLIFPIIASIESLVTTVAIILAGVWAYFHYVKGRVYSERVEIEVVGRVLTISSRSYLVITYQIKNVGSSRVPIQNDRSGIPCVRIYTRTDFVYQLCCV